MLLARLGLWLAEQCVVAGHLLAVAARLVREVVQGLRTFLLYDFQISLLPFKRLLQGGQRRQPFLVWPERFVGAQALLLVERVAESLLLVAPSQ